MRERDPSLLICLRSIILATEYLNTPHRLQPNRHPLRAGPGRRSVLTLSAASAAGPSPCDARLPPRRGNSSRARGIALDRVRDHPRPLPQPSPHPPRLPPNPLRFPSGSWHASQRVTDGLLRIVSPHVRSIQRALIPRLLPRAGEGASRAAALAKAHSAPFPSVSEGWRVFEPGRSSRQRGRSS